MLQLEDLAYPVLEEKLFYIDANTRTVIEIDPAIIVYDNITEYTYSLNGYDIDWEVDGVECEVYTCNVDNNGTKFYCHITKDNWSLYNEMPNELLVLVLQN